MSMNYGQTRHSNIRVNGSTYELVIEKMGDQYPTDRRYYYSVIVDNAEGYIDGYASSIIACSVAARDDVAWFAC